MWVVTLIIGVLFLVTGLVGLFTKEPNAWISLMFGATWLKLMALEHGAGL